MVGTMRTETHISTHEVETTTGPSIAPSTAASPKATDIADVAPNLPPGLSLHLAPPPPSHTSLTCLPSPPVLRAADTAGRKALIARLEAVAKKEPETAARLLEHLCGLAHHAAVRDDPSIAKAATAAAHRVAKIVIARGDSEQLSDSLPRLAQELSVTCQVLMRHGGYQSSAPNHAVRLMLETLQSLPESSAQSRGKALDALAPVVLEASWLQTKVRHELRSALLDMGKTAPEAMDQAFRLWLDRYTPLQNCPSHGVLFFEEDRRIRGTKQFHYDGKKLSQLVHAAMKGPVCMRAGLLRGMSARDDGRLVALRPGMPKRQQVDLAKAIITVLSASPELTGRGAITDRCLTAAFALTGSLTVTHDLDKKTLRAVFASLEQLGDPARSAALRCFGAVVVRGRGVDLELLSTSLELSTNLHDGREDSTEGYLSMVFDCLRDLPYRDPTGRLRQSSKLKKYEARWATAVDRVFDSAQTPEQALRTVEMFLQVPDASRKALGEKTWSHVEHRCKLLAAAVAQTRLS